MAEPFSYYVMNKSKNFWTWEMADRFAFFSFLDYGYFANEHANSVFYVDEVQRLIARIQH